jgi:RNA polymerase sigma factor (sigma-70 family)
MKPSSFNSIPVKELTEQVSRDFQTTIQYQFDCLARKVMIRTQSNCRRSAGRKVRKECPFSEMPEKELNRLQTLDTYHLDGKYYLILKFRVEVGNEAVANALDSIPEEKRNILLMFYFLEMSDAEIALELGKDRSTIYRSRTRALAALKRRLEGEDL